MADIEIYTLNLGRGRALRTLDFASAKSACTEVRPVLPLAEGARHG